MIPRGWRVYGSVEEHEYYYYYYPNFAFLPCIVSFGSCSEVLLFSAQTYSVTSARECLVPPIRGIQHIHFAGAIIEFHHESACMQDAFRPKGFTW